MKRIMRVKKEKSKVFQATPAVQNVAVNRTAFASNETQFARYAAAFHEAARSLVTPLLKTPRFNDFDALPVVYLYRHALELYLKGIVLSGNRLFVFEGEPIPEEELSRILRSHRLTPLLPHVIKIFETVGWDSPLDLPEIETVDDLLKVLKDIEEVDADSFAFRYPTDKKLEKSLPEDFEFDIWIFGAVIDPLLDLLDSAIWGLEDAYDNACEAYASIEHDYS